MGNRQLTDFYHIDRDTAPTYFLSEETEQTDQWNEILFIIKEYSKDLTIKQKKILILFCDGYSIRDISVLLGIKESEIYWYKKRIIGNYIQKLVYDRRLRKIIHGMSPFFRKKLNKWIRDNRDIYNDPSEYIYCPICGDRFKTKNEFRIHIRWKKRHHKKYDVLISDQNKLIKNELIRHGKYANKWVVKLEKRNDFYFSKSYIWKYSKKLEKDLMFKTARVLRGIIDGKK